MSVIGPTPADPRVAEAAERYFIAARRAVTRRPDDPRVVAALLRGLGQMAHLLNARHRSTALGRLEYGAGRLADIAAGRPDPPKAPRPRRPQEEDDDGE